MSRDRLGVRPLFYTVAGGALLFASEIKALLTCPGVSRDVDPAALDQAFTFWSPLAPRTMFAHIHALPPAHVLTIAAWCRGGATGTGRSTTPDRSTTERSEREHIERARELVDDATRLRLRADVPVGAYLSGGLDSTLIAALARRAAGRRLRTLLGHVRRPPSSMSGPQQEAAVRFLGIDHSSIHCTAARRRRRRFPT